MEWNLKKIEDWEPVAATVASELKPGAILGLSGPLGAGKTTFVQYLAKELGASGAPKSPTFSLLRTYQLRSKYPLKRLVHIDAYRIEKPEDLLPLNLEEELAEPGTVLVIEWAERVAPWLNRHAERVTMLKIDHAIEGNRRVSWDG